MEPVATPWLLLITIILCNIVSPTRRRDENRTSERRPRDGRGKASTRDANVITPRHVTNDNDWSAGREEEKFRRNGCAWWKIRCSIIGRLAVGVEMTLDERFLRLHCRTCSTYDFVF